MSHEINSTDVFSEVRYNGQRAWHGLGTSLPQEVITAAEAFEFNGLDWETTKKPVFYTDESGESLAIPGQFAHIRQDTGELLGMVAERYKPLENRQLADFADAVSIAGEGAARVETCGSLRSGKTVFALMELDKSIDVNGDVTKPYIMVSNGHGATAGLRAYFTGIRVVCANTEAMSLADLGTGVSFAHTGDLDGKVAAAKLILGRANEAVATFEREAQFLAQTTWNRKAMEEGLRTVWEAVHAEALRGAKTSVVGRAKLEQQCDEDVRRWIELASAEGNSVRGTQGTAFAALQGVTYDFDHAPAARRRLSPDARVNSRLFGTASRQKSRARTQILQLVGA